MIRVVIGGATGKLGSLVCTLLQEQDDMLLVGAVVSDNSINIGKKVAPGVHAVGASNLPDVLKEADVYVDLTSPSAAEKNIPKIARNGLAYIIGTTGISTSSLDSFGSMLMENKGSAVLASNFSVGVNVFFKTCEQLSQSLPGYDVEIIELHHNKKMDAPSGTAREAAETISRITNADGLMCGREGEIGARGKEIGIHSARLGDVVGEHTVIFAGHKERIELTHRAHSREAFAEGCIVAIRWVAGRNDGKIHTMREVLGI
ncbi:MAG: 4-hydroxy-tetrahydrodipicolinate reductase [Euryarchaeota archaeon]|nr:4-hydroxy-tetrahydrodipicolinate reductase [Euryarchaeota archaeon]